MGFTVVVGNPKPASRTLSAAVMVAEKLAGAPPEVVVDVVELGAGLLGWGDAAVTAAVESVQKSQAVVVASPTFKATYTGLVKLLLGAGPAHALAPELLLKPVLVELGATCPTKGLYLVDTSYDDPDAIEPWLTVARPQVLASMGEAL